MTCYYPKPGKRTVWTVGAHKIKEDIMRPCGQCIGCRLERARQWAVRITHEASMYEENCFITLTYNNENLPIDKSVHKRDLQLFFKRLRKELNFKPLKYYACGEYGEKGGKQRLYGPEGLGRPHYHACLLGHQFSDKVLLHSAHVGYFKNHFKVGPDHNLYDSPKLAEIWGKGFVTIGELTFQSAGYVARYCMKKIGGDKKYEHYGTKNPEFALISKGIGKTWFEKYESDCYPKDFVTVNGKKQKPPRYYEYLLEKKNPEKLKRIKREREEKTLLMDCNIRDQQCKIKEVKTKILKRSLHNEKCNESQI